MFLDGKTRSVTAPRRRQSTQNDLVGHLRRNFWSVGGWEAGTAGETLGVRSRKRIGADLGTVRATRYRQYEVEACVSSQFCTVCACVYETSQQLDGPNT